MSRLSGIFLLVLQLALFWTWQANAQKVNATFCVDIQKYCINMQRYCSGNAELPPEPIKCENGGVLRGGRCYCSYEYTGAHCETMIVPECNCLNGGQCYGDGRCLCAYEFTGNNCETRIYEPVTNRPERIRDCENGGVKGRDGYCRCPSGFTGNYCQIKLPINDCNCRNGGVCYDDGCHCSHEYTGTYCETKLPLYDCMCQNGGECHSEGCYCAPGFTGRYCESRLPVNDCMCQNGGKCHSEGCYCAPGFTGRYCESRLPVNDCMCQNGGECYADGCHCSSGYTGRYCETKTGCLTQSIYNDAIKDYYHPPSCLPVCSKPDIKHPLYEVNSHYIISNGKHMLTKFELQCAHPYRLDGDSTLNCVADGQWHQPIPQCLADINVPSPIYLPTNRYTTCNDPGTPSNGMRVVNHGRMANMTVGTSITFSCYQGYNLVGSRKIDCTYYGTWTASIPRCVLATTIPSAVRCPLPSAILNGRYFIVHRGLDYNSNTNYASSKVAEQIASKPGDYVRFYCDDGFEMIGSGNSECLSNGQWNSSAPVCQTSCGVYPGYNMYKNVSTAPWHLSIYKYDHYGKSLVCGATLISRNYAITSAACVTHQYIRQLLPVNTLRLHLGHFKESSPSKEYQIKSINMHHRYDIHTKDSDIALIELDKPIHFSHNVRPICLPTIADPREILRYEVPEKITGIVTGLGFSEGGTFPQHLKQFVMTTISRSFCQQEFNRYAEDDITVSSNMFCAAGQLPGGHGACYGDGGGSFAVTKDNYNFVLYGIVSMGRPNCEPKYTLFVNVAKYVAWIKENARL
ncbi:peptidase domain containing associated with muscle reproteinration 1 [Chamberlinius hualienensis]